jgi:protein required for attachment to host cells
MRALILGVFIMPIHNRLLIVIADGGHARFVRPVPETNDLHSTSRVIPADSHKAEAGHTDAGTHHAQVPHHDKRSHDPQGHEKAEFAEWIAAELNRDSGAYDELVLVAPPHVLNRIAAHLGAIAAAKLTGRLDKDLTKLPDHELSSHLREWVRPVHREKLL